VADPDLELRGAQFCFACPAGFSSFCDFFFFCPKQGTSYKYQIKKGMVVVSSYHSWLLT